MNSAKSKLGSRLKLVFEISSIGCVAGLLALGVVWFFASRSTPVRLNPASQLRQIGLRFRCGVNDVVLSFEQMQALNRWNPKRTASNLPNPGAAAPSP